MNSACEKNLCKSNKRTIGAEDTQNQHYQRVHAVVDTSSSSRAHRRAPAPTTNAVEIKKKCKSTIDLSREEGQAMASREKKLQAMASPDKK